MEFLRNREQLLEELAQLREKQIQALKKEPMAALRKRSNANSTIGTRAFGIAQ